MPSINPLVLLLLAPLVTALPNITAIPLIPYPYNLCMYYPQQSSGSNTGEPFFLLPSSTSNATLNTLHNSLNLATSPPTLDIISDSMVAWIPYRCNASTGDLGFLSTQADGVSGTFFFTSDPEERELKHMAAGLRPETYAHEIQGVRQEGTFLGLENSTRWAFKFVLGPGGAGSEELDRWDMRLLGKGMVAREEELEGFLRIVGA